MNIKSKRAHSKNMEATFIHCKGGYDFLLYQFLLQKEKIQADSTNSIYVCCFGPRTIPETSQASRQSLQSDLSASPTDGPNLWPENLALQSRDSCSRASHLRPPLDHIIT